MISKNKSSKAERKYAHVSANRSTAALRGAFWSAVSSNAPTILGALVFIITSRYLSPRDFGVVALASSVISMASAIAPVAFGEALIQQQNINNRHLNSVFWICIISAIIIYSVLIAAINPITSYLNQPEAAEFLPVLGLKLFFDLSGTVPNALISRSMSFHIVAARTVIATIISSAICIALLVYGYGAWSLVVSQVFGSVTTCVTSMLGAKWMPRFEFGVKEIKELLRYGLFASANRILSLLSLDQLIIGVFIGQAPLGIFNFSRRLFQMVNDIIAGALTSVTHSLFSSMQQEKEKLRDAFLFATFGSSIVSFPAFVGLACVVGDLIPTVFGSQWVDAVVPTRWFCVIGLLSCIGLIQASLFKSQGKTDWWFYYQLLRQFITIGSIYVFRDRGISFIVMTIAIQVIVFLPITLVMVSKLIDIKVITYFRQFFAPFSACVIMMLSVLLAAYDFEVGAYGFNDVPIISRLVVEIALGAVIYSFSILLFCGDRLKLIADSLKKKR